MGTKAKPLSRGTQSEWSVDVAAAHLWLVMVPLGPTHHFMLIIWQTHNGCAD